MTGIVIRTLETPSLGDRSYLVHDGEVAFVVDPQRDIDRVIDLAAKEQVRVTHVFETHIHNDYVTGGLALAERTGAAYHVNGEDRLGFDRTPTFAGDVVSVGDGMRVRAIATPGHTFTHLAYALEVDGSPAAVFTGGSLLYGATGRPDLLGPEHTEELTRLQHGSAQRLAELPDETPIYPTHGFGSFCAAGSSSEQPDESTIGREKRANPALTESEEAYVRQIVQGLDVYPAYYAHMGPANAAGPSAPDLSQPEKADADELRRRLEAGEWLVDLRTRTAFAAGHVPGTYNYGADGQFSTYVGWMIQWGTPITLLGESEEQVAEAQRELVRIGIDKTAASATGKPESWTHGELASYPLASFADLAEVRHHREVVVLDVRRASEHDEGHIEGAVNIPIHEVADRVGDVPDEEVWVHCMSGYRASIAASFLAAAGRRVVLVDDDYGKAEDAGLTVTA
ncbi:MAG TPA: MBL fold metallo-hydrolase [Nocardioidaceae bacterium]|nr:MBL fold metallo-hydrolase [Nocardioidaceae bacterium]